MNARQYIRTASQALLCLLLLVTASQPAYGGQQENPAKALAAEGVAAMGGEDVARGWTTRVDKGLLTSIWPGWGELQANCSRFVKKPDKIKIDQDFSAFDHPFFFTWLAKQSRVVSMDQMRFIGKFDSLCKKLCIEGPALDKCGRAFILSKVRYIL